jgi:hypothetical protein
MANHRQKDDTSRYADALCNAHRLNKAKAFQETLHALKEFHFNPLNDKALISLLSTSGNMVYRDNNDNLEAICEGVKVNLDTAYYIYNIYYKQGHQDSSFAPSSTKKVLLSDNYLQKVCNLFITAEKSNDDPNYKDIGDQAFKFVRENPIHPPYTTYDNHNDFIRTDDNQSFTVRCSGKEYGFKFEDSLS